MPPIEMPPCWTAILIKRERHETLEEMRVKITCAGDKPSCGKESTFGLMQSRISYEWRPDELMLQVQARIPDLITQHHGQCPYRSPGGTIGGGSGAGTGAGTGT